MDLQALLLPLFLLWFAALGLLCFRGEIAWIWKGAGLFIFLFYTLFFGEELLKSWDRYTMQFLMEFPRFLTNFMKLLPFLLLLFWPVFLLIAYNSNSIRRSERIIRNMVLLTLFYWLFWISTNYFYFPPRGWSSQQIIQKIRNFRLPEPP